MAAKEPQSVTGTGVVPGIACAPAAWAQQRRHVARDTRVIDETDRESEKTRFLTAANTVADRFTRRASTASGVASEVLTASAALAKDRGWLRAAQKLIASGTPAASATEDAIAQFVAHSRSSAA